MEVASNILNKLSETEDEHSSSFRVRHGANNPLILKNYLVTIMFKGANNKDEDNINEDFLQCSKCLQ
jgi:hypothetical protein